MLLRMIKGSLILVSIVVSFLLYWKVEALRLGGPVMALILLSSVFVLAVIFEKYFQFNREGRVAESLLKNIFESIERQRIKEAIDICDQADNGISRILKAGIMKYDRPKEEIKESMQDAFLYEIPSLEDKLPLLSTLVQIVPILGLLGTLVGLMNILRVIQAKTAVLIPVTTADFLAGVWQALVCSIAGFIIMIPGLIACNYFNHRVKIFVEEMERASTELLNFLLERRMP